MAVDIIDKIIEDSYQLTNTRLCKENCLLMITGILATCKGCQCVKLIIRIVTPQKTPESNTAYKIYDP